MPRTSAARDKVLQVAAERLEALVGARQVPTISEPQPLVIDTPKDALRPVARIGVVVCLLVASMVWLNRPQAVTPIDVQATGVMVSQPDATTSVATQSATRPQSTIVVDVEGHVHHPGLVTLPIDSRVADAIAKAGGLTKRVTPGALNLAQKVTDGQLIVVSSGAAQASSQSVGDGAAGTASALINLNTASATDLDALPGVGPVMSTRIVAWRTENGGFRAVDDLQQVPGIGPKVFANLKPLVCV